MLTKKIDPMDKKSNFTLSANQPGSWKNQAETLLLSANALKEKKDALSKSDWIKSSRFSEPVLMLRGMALECLFKGLWLKNGGILAENGKLVLRTRKRWPRILENILQIFSKKNNKLIGISNHDLVKLAKRCQYNLLDEQKIICEKLSRYITAGRYPVGSQPTKERISYYKGQKVAEHPLQWNWSADDQCLEELQKDLLKLLS